MLSIYKQQQISKSQQVFVFAFLYIYQIPITDMCVQQIKYINLYKNILNKRKLIPRKIFKLICARI